MQKSIPWPEISGHPVDFTAELRLRPLLIGEDIYYGGQSGGVGQGPERHVTETALPTIGMQLTEHR